MTVARDWTKTLWPASYKGVPFWVESDAEEGGRRIVVHQFPMRDDPFLEDLGEDKRTFEVVAYVASDSADVDAATVVAICLTRGPGILVLPAHGPIRVRGNGARRYRERDMAGYIALRLNFIREGAAGALVSVAMLANRVFLAAESIAGAIAAAFVANVTPANPDFVFDEAVAATQDVLAALETVRSTEPVEVTASAAQRNAIQALFDGAADLIVDPQTIASVPAGVVAVARALGDALPADRALAAFRSLAVEPSLQANPVGARYVTPAAAAAAANRDAANRALRLAALTAFAEAVARADLKDRPSGIRLRAEAAELFESELLDLPASEMDLARAIGAIRDAVIEYLSRVVLDLAPVLTIEANLSKSSLYWSWRLYADPARSGELVERNGVVHPSLMPLAFEALAR
ncbi:phage tail/DNA circulation protein [Rhodopseudomonas palustris]|uniref:DNA circularization N-terminal domain-containing protein n=1 Tax=Rhodopseudomonas palustris TaxID=1076 RepID=UPI000D19DE23|nr:DNA circularization N-terminal domain-containing protein [Rhodopseudomonas palustris]AVT76641.1 phage tail/DNA circulation protein [Rhodopseudomonas palustris]